MCVCIYTYMHKQITFYVYLPSALSVLRHVHTRESVDLCAGTYVRVRAQTGHTRPAWRGPPAGWGQARVGTQGGGAAPASHGRAEAPITLLAERPSCPTVRTGRWRGGGSRRPPHPSLTPEREPGSVPRLARPRLPSPSGAHFAASAFFSSLLYGTSAPTPRKSTGREGPGGRGRLPG